MREMIGASRTGWRRGLWISPDPPAWAWHIRRLSIIDLSDAAAQPMSNGGRVAADRPLMGEIYKPRGDPMRA